jgi:quinol-cytochrome oxidoreductase complex cytochrome b subunit
VGLIPLVGSNLREILSGGNSINSITLQHMYALHSHILVIAAIFCSITHLTALICQEQQGKPENKQFRLTQLCSEYPSKEDSSSV